MTSSLMITADEAAKALRISPRKLWELAKDGEIPKVKIGRSVRYDITDIKQWIIKQKEQQSNG